MRIPLIVSIAVGSVLISTVAVAQLSRAGYDGPQYEVIKSAGSFEIREYAPRLVAETTVSRTDWREATSVGFGRLADFIFGANRTSSGESAKIAMTSPVESVPTREATAVVFTMPPEYSAESLPQPTDDRVVVRMWPAATVATWRFRGNARRQDVETMTAALLDAVRANGYEPTSQVRVAQYDPPWIPGPLRRNELMVDIVAAGDGE